MRVSSVRPHHAHWAHPPPYRRRISLAGPRSAGSTRAISGRRRSAGSSTASSRRRWSQASLSWRRSQLASMLRSVFPFFLLPSSFSFPTKRTAETDSAPPHFPISLYPGIQTAPKQIRRSPFRVPPRARALISGDDWAWAT